MSQENISRANTFSLLRSSAKWCLRRDKTKFKIYEYFNFITTLTYILFNKLLIVLKNLLDDELSYFNTGLYEYRKLQIEMETTSILFDSRNYFITCVDLLSMLLHILWAENRDAYRNCRAINAACCVFGFTAVTRAQSSSSIWICLKASLDSIWAFATVHAILIVCIARSPAYGRHTSVNYSRYGNLLRLVTHSRNLIVTAVEWICDTRAMPILTRTRRVRQVNAKFPSSASIW